MNRKNMNRKYVTKSKFRRNGVKVVILHFPKDCTVLRRGIFILYSIRIGLKPIRPSKQANRPERNFSQPEAPKRSDKRKASAEESERVLQVINISVLD